MNRLTVSDTSQMLHVFMFQRSPDPIHLPQPKDLLSPGKPNALYVPVVGSHREASIWLVSKFAILDDEGYAFYTMINNYS
jgi:hypothetical protein